MKIICVGRNYGAHARELNNDVPDQPVIFLKPDTALLRDNAPFFLPDLGSIHYECELVLRIGKAGKKISPAFAHKYIDSFTLGIDFTARELQDELKKKGLPWELAKAFDHSAVIGQLFPASLVSNWEQVQFRLDIDEKTVQEGNSEQMLFSIPEIISFVSRYFTLRTGDLIFTGTPAGVGAVNIGNILKGYLLNPHQDGPVFAFEVK